VPSKNKPEDLSADELRWMLVEKRRAARQERLERFRRTGRAVILAPNADASLDNFHSGVIEDADASQAAIAGRSRARKILDGLLLLVEVGAVAGILFVLFSITSALREVNQEFAAAQVQPTLTPTPLILAVVLPSGHTPPNAGEAPRPNDAEIPDHLRPLVQSLANVPVPTPGLEQAIRIQIPAIRVDAPVVQGDGWEQLKKGVGQHIGSADPGKDGNLVLSAHNDIFGEIFRDLDQLKPGDAVVIFTNQRSYTYVVVETKIVEPTAVEVMAPTSKPTLTLISCYPYLVDNQRIVVQARLQGDGGS
jgi:sortase A